MQRGGEGYPKIHSFKPLFLRQINDLWKQNLLMVKVFIYSNIDDFIATPFQIITRLIEQKSRPGQVVKKPAQLKD